MTSCMLFCHLICAYNLSDGLGPLSSFLHLTSELLHAVQEHEGLECTRLLKAMIKWSKDMEGKKQRICPC